MSHERAESGGDAFVGKSLDGRYLIRERIGAGGMGMVYRGLQISIGREVAIKVVHPAMLGDRNAARRFLREVSLAARLSSPHTVQVIDFGETAEGTLYLVMELLSGAPLDAELRRAGRLGPRRVLELAVPISDALAAAHAATIVHRDLKPSNVFLARDAAGQERVKVLDFGIARGFGESTLTGSGEIVGSPPYVAPEAIRGEPLDGRADLYSLGCMMFQLLTGSPPFLAGSVADTFRLHLEASAPPLPAGTPRALAAILERLLAKRPAERFAGATEVRAALVAALADAPADAPLDEPQAKPAPRRDEPLEISITAATADTRDLGAPRPRRRATSPVVLGAGAFFGALAIAAIAWLAWPRTDAARAPDAPVDAAAPDAAAPDAATPDAAALDAAALADEPVDAAPPSADAPRRGSSTRTRDAGSRPPPIDAAPTPAPPRRDAGVGFVLPR